MEHPGTRVKALLAQLRAPSQGSQLNDDLPSPSEPDPTRLQPEPDSRPFVGLERTLSKDSSDPQSLTSSTNSSESFLNPSIQELLSRLSPSVLRQLQAGTSTHNAKQEESATKEDDSPRTVVFACLSDNPDLVKTLSQVFTNPVFLSHTLYPSGTAQAATKSSRAAPME
jgi:hypothetical protein